MMTEEEFFEKAEAMTIKEINEAYESHSDDEELIEQAIRDRISAYISENGEEEDGELVAPFECALEDEDMCGHSSLDMPWTTELREMLGEGIITVVLDSGEERDLEDLELEERMCILNNL